MPNPSGIDGTHSRRFTKDQSQFLSAYGVFHGDERHPSGEPLPTGSLRKSGGLTSGATSAFFLTQPGPPQPAYIIQPTMSLRSLQLKQQPLTAGKTLPSNRSVGLSSTTFNYRSGVTFNSTSGLPPTPYKSWSTEYVDEYRGSNVRKEVLSSLTKTHGTQDALRSTRYQFQGYPHAFKSYAPTSLTARGQVMPDYESRVKAF